MMKQGSLLKWTSSNGNKWSKNHGKPNWIHPPDALQRGHVAYLVKFLGKTEVDQPKGIDVVKEGIRKMKFSQHLRRAEGTKTPKVELTISVDGVAIQTPKSKKISFQYPLHRISYCADDKSDPKFFSFIAKEAESDRHSCFVFVSDKLSEEITLTIGQAFELAYRRFLETSGRDLEMRKQIMVLHKKVQELEAENRKKNRLANYKNKSRSSMKSSGSGCSSVLTNGSEINKLQPLQPPPPVQRIANRSHHQQATINLLDIDDQPTVGRKLENLSLDDQTFDPRSYEEIKVNSTTTSTTTKPLIGSSLTSSSINSSNSSVSSLSSSSSPPLSISTTSNQPLTVSSLSATTSVPPTTTTNSKMTTINSNGPVNSYPVNGHVNNLGHTNGTGIGHNQDNTTNEAKDIFGFEPFDPEANKTNGSDPFGMGSFEAKQLEQAIGDIDKKLAEMRVSLTQNLFIFHSPSLPSSSSEIYSLA
ncbi:PTB domain-containing adapter protein ced-6 isoform X1 [Tetranychus urticae]|uniref:PTB domain-containing adapter protein ced-6 isoform X1 n=1 Tax=Tetranychus urticae TaxID=32264 RepID=UPI00077BC09D|nr:PTB domain-containing adapter protein ced-6 isoform X1 [Tetranychus urticae]